MANDQSQSTDPFNHNPVPPKIRRTGHIVWDDTPQSTPTGDSITDDTAAVQAQHDARKTTAASSARLFPVHPIHRSYMTGIDWNIIAPHERQALRNHSQSLERLAQRGGLSLCELAAVIEDRPWRKMDPLDALAAVKKVCNG